MTAQADLTAISKWIDESPGYAGVDPEARLWRRVGKAGAEHGEVLDAMSGMLGENPRKGKTHSLQDVVKELLDEALAALGAVEHIYGNPGHALALLEAHIHGVALRAGVTDPIRDMFASPDTQYCRECQHIGFHATRCPTVFTTEQLTD